MCDALFINIIPFCQFQGVCSCREASLACDASLAAESIDLEIENGRNESHPLLFRSLLLSVLPEAS